MNALRLVRHQARYDIIAFVRNRQARFFTVALPVIFLVIFVEVFGNKTVGPEHLKSATYYVPGLAAMAVISASFVNLVMSITAQRELGVLKRRRATPVPAWVLIAGRAIAVVLVSLCVMMIVLAVGNLAYGVQLPSHTIPAVLITGIVGSVTFCCLGYALCTFISSADSAQPLLQAIMLPLYFISGVFIPSVNLPTWLHDVAIFFPVEHLASAFHNAFAPGVGGTGIVWSDIGILAAWGAFGLLVAIPRFGWLPSAAKASGARS
jgi:ABC-2 type transport system permease protein